MGMEPIPVDLAQVDAGVPLGQPLGQGPADPPGVGDPHGLSHPEPPRLRHLTEDGIPVWRERKEAIELRGEVGRREAGKSADGIGPALPEVLRCKPEDRRVIVPG